MEVLTRYTLYDDDNEELFESGDNVNVTYDIDGKEKNLVSVGIMSINKDNVVFRKKECNVTIPTKAILSIKMDDSYAW